MVNKRVWVLSFRAGYQSVKPFLEKLQGRDLLGLGRSQRCALGVEAATIARDRRDFGMALEPLREAISRTIRQKLDNSVQVQINQNRSVVLAVRRHYFISS